MMYFIVFVVAFALSGTETEAKINIVGLKSGILNLDHLEFDLSKEFFDALYINAENRSVGGGIVANVNDYADRLLGNIQHLIIRSGLDPFELPEQILKLIPTGTITLSQGWLQDISTISRNGDVTVSYSSSTKIMSLTVPIKFNVLLFTYAYRTKVLLLNIQGGANGKVENIKVNLNLSFDFGKYQASLDKFDIRDTGKISLKFTGNGLVDWLTNTMTSVVTIFLHPIIIRIIESIIKGGLESFVTEINGILNIIFQHGTDVPSNYLV